MDKKYLTEQELLQFISWCKENNIDQKEVAKIAGLHEQWISKVFASRKEKRNKNFKGDPKKIEKPNFERARARLVVLTKKDEAMKGFEEVDKI